MTGRPSQQGDLPLTDLQESKETYLQALRANAPDATFLSHQNVLRKFCSWHSSSSSKSKSPEKSLVEFAGHLLTTDQSIDTAIGHLHSLLNFLAFHHQSSPEELRTRLVSEIQSLSYPDWTTEPLTNEFNFSVDPGITRSVDALRVYLRQRQYGTRTHAFVELIYETTARPTQIRLLDRPDLHLDARTASIALSETHVITTSDLHNERTAVLPPSLTEVLETYLEHEREILSKSDCQPLFTTTHGRASTRTLRRSVKLASEKARDYHAATHEPNPDDSSSANSVTTVVPSDIWRVALNEVENAQ